MAKAMVKAMIKAEVIGIEDANQLNYRSRNPIKLWVLGHPDPHHPIKLWVMAIPSSPMQAANPINCGFEAIPDPHHFGPGR